MDGDDRADGLVEFLAHRLVADVDGHERGLPVVAVDDVRLLRQQRQQLRHRAAEEGEALAVVIIAVKLGTLEILLVVHEVPRHALPLVGEKSAVQAAPGKAHIGVALKVQPVTPRVRDALVERQNDVLQKGTASDVT